jgi:short-subunit dehydrogenase
MASPGVDLVLATGRRALRDASRRLPVARDVLNPTLEERVRGRTVMITGASAGIGREAALKVGAAGATVLLVARTREKLDEVAAEIEAVGGIPAVLPCDMNELEDIDRLVEKVLSEFGAPQVLVNNAGRSIRRSVRNSYDRFHDFERTMQLNYFGALRLTLGLLPAMRERHSGHLVNISTMGLQVNSPRFSAYLASKAAFDAFSRSLAVEVLPEGVHVTTVYMPLVRTEMIAPTKHYERLPALSADAAAEMIIDAIRRRPKRILTPLGAFVGAMYAAWPGPQDEVLSRIGKLVV